MKVLIRWIEAVTARTTAEAERAYAEAERTKAETANVRLINER